MTDPMTKAMIRLQWGGAGLDFWASLAFCLEPVARENIPTCGTDGEHFFYNPTYWAGCSTVEQVGLLVHETSHCAFQDYNPEMRGGRDPFLWNMAADYLINLDIRDDMKLSLPVNALIDEKYRGMTREKIYSLLEKQVNKNQGSGKPCHLESPKDSAGNPSSERAKQLANEWRSRVVEAAEIAKQAGTLSPGLQNLVDSIMPKVDPFAVIRHWLGTRSKHEYQWHPPSRRYLPMGLYLPRLSGQVLSLCLIVDTSGSMSNAKDKLLGELRLLKGRYKTELDVWFVDTMVYGPTHFGIHQSIPASLEFQGGGGTNLQAAFDSIHEAVLNYDGVIVLTDGYTYPNPVKDTLGLPTLWVMIDGGGLSQKCADFGEIVKVDLE